MRPARHFDAIDLPPDGRLPDAQFILPEVLLKIDHARHEVAIIAHRDTQESLAEIERVIEQSPFRDDDVRRRRTSGSIWPRKRTSGRCVKPAASGSAGRWRGARSESLPARHFRSS